MSRSHIVSTRELAELMGVTTRTIARRVERGTLRPAYRIEGERGAMLFDLRELLNGSQPAEDRAA